MKRYKPLFEKEINQTDSKEFKKWFGKSKVVDKSGKPLVVYHRSGNINESIQRYKRLFTENIKGMTGDSFIDELITSPPHTEEDVKRLNKYLRANKNKTITLYHGTDASHNILQDGLLPTSAKRKKSLQSASGYVYLSVYKSMAKTFGEMANPYAKNIKVYKITLPINDLKVDNDQLKNKRMWSDVEIGNTLGDSLIYGSGARVKGAIPNYYIKEVN